VNRIPALGLCTQHQLLGALIFLLQLVFSRRATARFEGTCRSIEESAQAVDARHDEYPGNDFIS